MDLSSGIFVALAVGWACYLIPKALRHHDEVAKSRAIEHFSPATRVVARREPVSRREAVIVSAPDPRIAKLAAARAAARRRHILFGLFAVDVFVAGLVFTDVLGRVWVAAPVALTVGFLGLCRVLVRRERRTEWVAPARKESAPEAVVEHFGEETALLDLSDLQRATPEPAGSFWDPVPMAIPTYVGKESVQRTVRTIDLAADDVTSSGHDAADSRLVAEASANASEIDAEDEGDERMAAGA